MSLPLAVLAAVTAYAMLYGALLIPLSVLGHKQLAAFFLPLMWACDFYDICSWQGGLGPSAVVHAFRATDLLLFRNPREDFKVIHRKSILSTSKPSEKSEDWKEPYPETFWARLWWVNNVICSLRFTGLDTGDGHHSLDISAGGNKQYRGYWLLRECWRATWYFLIIDASNAYESSDPYFLGQSGIDASLPDFLLRFLGDNSRYWFMPRSIRMVVFGFQQYAVFSLCGSVPAISFVCLGSIGLVSDFWGHPSNWPPLMGNPLVLFQSGFRGLWGKGWHQLFRHVLADPGKALARALEIPPRSTASYAVQIAVAFFLSGVLHALTLPRDLPDPRPLRYAGFFWIQGICVLVELGAKGVFATPSKFIPTSMKRGFVLVRFVWAVAVLYCTLPMVDDELVKCCSKNLGTKWQLCWGRSGFFTKEIFSFMRSRW